MTSTIFPRFASHPRGMMALLLLLPACTAGPGIIGDATESDADPASTVADTDGADSTGGECPGGDCDGELAVAAFVGVNYHSRRIALFGSDTCDGPSCPPAVLVPPDEQGLVTRCQDTEEAQEALVGADEYCRFGAHLLFGLDFAVQGSLDRSSFELVRPYLGDHSQDEAYYWYDDVMRIEGPGTAYRGTYHPGNFEVAAQVSSLHNETCAARLDALGVAWTESELETLCQGTWDDGGQLRPLRMAPSMTFNPPRGELRTDEGSSCDTPSSGPDTCCSVCDYALGISVAPYGVDASGVRRQIDQGTAITCDPAGDALVECRDLVLDVDRSDQETAFTYAWDGAPQSWRLPWYDKIRETHPDLRPAAVEVVGPACANAFECDDGQDCIGTNASGQACHDGDDCQERHCRAPWFGTCQASLGVGYCRDARFDPVAAASCLESTVDFGDGSAGDRLANCDANGDGQLTPGECCDAALGGAAGCDPIGQPNLVPVAHFDRHPDQEAEAFCVCEAGAPESCADVVDAWCEAPLGTGSEPGPDSPAGGYAVPSVARRGGPRAEEIAGWLRMPIADLGNLERGTPELCAGARGRIEGRTSADGWLANDAFLAELAEDHDLALCSGSTYRVIFAESDDPHQLRSVGGATLDGRSEHVIETAQFRVVPLSLFPTDNLKIDACASISLGFGAVYDQGPVNLRKIELHEGSAAGPLVAGGPDCDPEADPAEVAAGAIPCLTVDVTERVTGALSVQIDPDRYGEVLVPGTTYTVVVPGLASIEQMADPELYAAAFHDACGMPLVLGDTPELVAQSQQSFTVDEPCP